MDDIKEKLNRIDDQLADGKTNSYRQIVTSSPLLSCAISLIAGVVIQNTFSLSLWFWLLLILSATITAIVSLVIEKSPQKIFTVVCAVMVCFICLGAVRLINFHHPAPNDIRNFVDEERQLATIRGVILTEPYTAEPAWQFAQFSHNDPLCSFYLDLRETETVNGWTKACGTTRMQVAEPVLDLKAGDCIEALCWLDRFAPATNPGQFDMAKYTARNNVFIAASVESRDGISLLKNHGDKAVFTKIKQKLTEIAMTSLLDSAHAEDQNQKLLQALVLGYKSSIDSDIYLAFRKTGLLHFICLSGMNFAIVIGIVWWLCRIAGLMKPARAIACLIATALFLLVIPPQAPAFRAAIMCFVFCASFFFRRHPNTLNSLSLAAIILLLINPMQLFDVGWQLSFTAVLGILLFTNRISFFLHEKITSHPWILDIPKTNLFFRIIPRPGSFLLNCFSVSFAAWLVASGIMLYHFYTINVLTTLWTVIVSPLIAVVSIIGYFKMVLALLLPNTASLLGIVALTLADWLIWSVKFIASLDKFNMLIGHVPFVFIVFYYAAIFFTAFAHFRQRTIKTVVLALMLLTIITFLGVTKFHRTYHRNLVVTCLDVGHGQAVVAQMPGNKIYLFDAGSQNRSDIGSRIIIPFLNYTGVSKLDAIFISHGDIDHINGIPEVVKFCKVNAIYADEAFFKINKPTTEFLRNWLKGQNSEIQPVKNSNIPGVKILWPDDDARANDQLSENDESAVSLIESGNVKILLCSDIEKSAQANLLKLFPNLKPDVVVVPHHGSLRTRLPDFLNRLNANVLIYSCGQRQFDLLKNSLSTVQANSFYTYTDGAITISIDKEGVTETFKFASK